MKKVKDVINGYNAKYGIDNLHIIDTTDNDVCFTGSFSEWENCISCMKEYKKECENKIVLNQICHDFNTLFLFV